MTPSRSVEQWRGMDGVFKFQRQTVEYFLQTLQFDSLREVAEKCSKSEHGNGGAVLRTDQFSAGRERVVYEIEFPDGTLWVARITLPRLPLGLYDCTLLPSPGLEVMQSEVDTMRYVSSHTSIPVPRVIAYDFQHDNPLGAPYMLMEEVSGKLFR